MAIDVAGYVPAADLRMQEFIQVIRLSLRDYGELNRLIRGEEHSNRQIAWAIIDTLDDYNTTPPLIGQATLADFPSMSLLRKGATVNLLKSVGLLGTRNSVRFTDGGFSYDTDKTRALVTWLQLLENEYEKKKLRLKTALNIEAAWGGGVHSEYLWVSSGWYGSWS